MNSFLAAGPTDAEAIITVLGVIVGGIVILLILFKKDGPKR